MIRGILPHRPTFALLISIGLGLSSPPVSANDSAQEFVSTECAGCHAIEKPDSFSITRIQERKAPDLYYAGNKFQEEWMVNWLQAPTPLRPGGTFFGQKVVAGEDRDIVPEEKLPPHPTFKESEAQLAVSYLKTLKPYEDLISQTDYSPKPISGAMGRMNFTKFKGCVACHELEKGYGGISGPEVYTAGARLKPDFLFSFIKNPQAWEPKTFMPNAHLSDGEVQKLADFIRTLAEE
ncbi:c-type cytochrome [Marinobacter sp. PE14]